MTARAALLRACFLLTLVAGSRQLSIKDFTVPIAVELGQEAELRCQYELGEGETEDALYVKWWWSPSDSLDDRTQIYQRISGRPAEVIHNKDRKNTSKIEIKDHDTLVLESVMPADSGSYECEVSNIDEKRQHAALTVFSMGTGPTLNYSIIAATDDEPDKLLIECEAADVAPTPDLIVTINGEPVNTTEYRDDTDGDGFQNIHGNATLSLSGLEESEIRCELVFVDDKIPHQPYVDVTTYVPAGDAAGSTTETPEDVTEAPATPDSLQNPSNDGIGLHSSLVLLTVATLFTRIRFTL